MTFVEIEIFDVFLSETVCTEFTGWTKSNIFDTIVELFGVSIQQINYASSFSIFSFGNSQKDLIWSSFSQSYLSLVKRRFSDKVSLFIKTIDPLNTFGINFEPVSGSFIESGCGDEMFDYLIVPGCSCQSHISVVYDFFTFGNQWSWFDVTCMFIEDADWTEGWDEVNFILWEV